VKIRPNEAEGGSLNFTSQAARSAHQKEDRPGKQPIDPFDGMIPIGAGREAEVFLLANGNVLKLMRDTGSQFRVEREVIASAAANEQAKRAPEIQGTTVIDNRPGLISERIDGPDLLTRLGGAPWDVGRAGAVMARVHAAMHEATAPPSLPNLNEELRTRIGTASGLPDELADYALSTLERLPEGDRLCHGDFHLGNILGTWDQPLTIDWGKAARGVPLADVAQTMIVHRIGDPPPKNQPLLRLLTPIGRGILVRRYLSTYRKLRPIQESSLDRWKVVRAAARFRDGIEIEFATLTELISTLRSRLSSTSGSPHKDWP
jgi:hypothetical protein